MSLRNIIASHLGIKPVRGGRPPSDSSVILNMAAMVKEFINMLGIWENDEVPQICSIINIGIIIAEYNEK